MGGEVVFTGVRRKEDVVPDEEGEGGGRESHTLVSTHALLGLLDREVAERERPRRVFENSIRCRVPPVADYDHLKRIPHGLLFYMVQASSECCRTPIGGDDDGEKHKDVKRVSGTNRFLIFFSLTLQLLHTAVSP